MRIENSNSDIRVLVLARPADSMCAILASALNQWGHDFSMYSTVYEVVNTIKEIPADLPVVLIVRPLMLGVQAAGFINRHFPNLRMIGWIDSDENTSDWAITQMTIYGMVLINCLDQFQQVINPLRNTVSRIRSVTETVESTFSKEPDRLEYELSDDEVNALLGVV